MPFVRCQVKNHAYGKTESFAGEKFPSDLFLVFANRLLALIVSAAMVMLPIRSEPPGGWSKQVSLAAQLSRETSSLRTPR